MKERYFYSECFRLLWIIKKLFFQFIFLKILCSNPDLFVWKITFEIFLWFRSIIETNIKVLYNRIFKKIQLILINKYTSLNLFASKFYDVYEWTFCPAFIPFQIWIYFEWKLLTIQRVLYKKDVSLPNISGYFE